MMYTCQIFFFFFNHPATTEIYTLSLHDALPIWSASLGGLGLRAEGCGQLLAHSMRSGACFTRAFARRPTSSDRKSTRLNSSHVAISYAVFCLKKKKKKPKINIQNTPPQDYRNNI